MNTEMQLLALDDSSLDTVSGGRHKYYDKDWNRQHVTATNTTTVSNSTITVTNGNVNIGNQDVTVSQDND